MRPAGPRVCVSSSVGRSTGRSLFNEYHAPASVVYCNQGVLLVGFGAEDAAALQTWFASIEPGFPVSCCSDELLGATLEEAVTASDGTFRHVLEWQECKELVPRVAIFSGMSQEETEGMAEFWSTSGENAALVTTPASFLIGQTNSPRWLSCRDKGANICKRGRCHKTETAASSFAKCCSSLCWQQGPPG